MNCFYLCLIVSELCVLCPGIESRKSFWVRKVDQSASNTYTIFPNTMFKGAYVTVQVICSSKTPGANVRVQWILEELKCMEDMFKTVHAETLTGDILTKVTYDMLHKTDHLILAPDREIRGNNNKTVTETVEAQSTVRNVKPSSDVKGIRFMVSEPQTYPCSENNIINLKDETGAPYYIGYYKNQLPENDPDYFRWQMMNSNQGVDQQNVNRRVATAWESGVYHFILKIEPFIDRFKFNATVIVKMKSGSGYLPAIEWPLLPVRGILALLYLCVGTGWIILWARSHQHSLKIHLIIGAVALAGALANTLSFIELSDQNSTGNGIEALKWLSIFMTVLQNGLLQLLVMVVSTGYGITRPYLHKALLASAVVLATLSSVTQFMSAIALDEDIKIKYNHPVWALSINTIYAIFTVVIGGWLMVFAVMTFLHLCRRKHSSKKIVSFTIFTVTCVLAFFVNLILGVVSIGITRDCTKDWRLEWLFKSYSSMTSLVLMGILMWLWQPVDEAQSYAFTLLSTLDEAGQDQGSLEEEDEDETLFEKSELHILNT